MKQDLRAVAVAALLGLHPAIAAAAVWNVVSDFSIGSNPNGAWAYGYGAAGSSFVADSSASTFHLGPTDLWSRHRGDPVYLRNGNPMVAENMGAAYNWTTVVVPTGFFGYTQVSAGIPWCSGQLQRREPTRTLVNSSSWTYTQPASSERSSGERSGTQRNSTAGR
jgi:hypothetical protein